MFSFKNKSGKMIPDSIVRLLAVIAVASLCMCVWWIPIRELLIVLAFPISLSLTLLPILKWGPRLCAKWSRSVPLPRVVFQTVSGWFRITPLPLAARLFCAVLIAPLAFASLVLLQVFEVAYGTKRSESLPQETKSASSPGKVFTSSLLEIIVFYRSLVGER